MGQWVGYRVRRYSGSVGEAWRAQEIVRNNGHGRVLGLSLC